MQYNLIEPSDFYVAVPIEHKHYSMVAFDEIIVSSLGKLEVLAIGSVIVSERL